MAELTPKPDKYKAAGIGVVPPELGVVDQLGKPIAPLANSTTFATDLAGNNNIFAGNLYAFRPVLARLKTAMAAALIFNPVIAQPLVQPAAWVTATTYAAGQAVSNAGNNYVCLGGVASSATAPTGTGTAPIADGAGYWYYAGPTFTSATNAPTFTNVAFAARYTGNFFTNTNCTYGIGAARISDTSNFLITGAVATEDGTNGSLRMAGGFAGAYGLLRVEFMTDAAAFQLVCVSSTSPGIFVQVDGVPLTLGSLGSNSAAGNFVQIVFPTPSVRGRRITVEINPNIATFGFLGVLMNDTTSRVWAPQNPNKVRGFMVGTSYLSGSSWHPPGVPLGLPAQIFNLLGVSDFAWDNSGAGSGYQAAGTYGIFNTPARVAALQAYAPDFIVVFGGGINDWGVGGLTLANEQAAATTYLQNLRSVAPYAPIFVIGSECGARGPDANLLLTEQAVSNAVAALADPAIIFIPQAGTSANKSWISGTGTVTTGGAGTINNSALATSTDGIHPVLYGLNLMAYRAANGIRNAVALLS